MRFPAFLAIVLAGAVAAAAPCGNCSGERIVGPGPVRFACPVCQGTGAIPDPAPTSAAHRPTVARVEAASGPSRAGGSGVLVAVSGRHGLVLTNWHVVRSHRESVAVHWPDGSKSPARILETDDAWDLAALLVARPAVEPVTLAAQAPRRGDRLTIAGYGSPPFLYREDSGPCTEYLAPTPSHPSQLVELRAAARQGDSGGPIFNAGGELAGVLFGTKDGLTVGPCSTRIRIFLAGVQWPRELAAAGREGEP